MGVVFRRRFKAFFRTMTGYIYLAVFCLFASVYFLVFNLLAGSNTLEYMFADLLLAAIVLLPVIVMIPRFAEQRKGTEKFWKFFLNLSRHRSRRFCGFYAFRSFRRIDDYIGAHNRLYRKF